MSRTSAWLRWFAFLSALAAGIAVALRAVYSGYRESRPAEPPSMIPRPAAAPPAMPDESLPAEGPVAEERGEEPLEEAEFRERRVAVDEPRAAPPDEAEPVGDVPDDAGTVEPLPPDAFGAPPEALGAALEEAMADVPPPGTSFRARSPESYLDEGNVYFNVGQFRLAVDRYTKALELNPSMASAYYNRANAYARMGEYDAALADYNRALELSPNDPDVLNNRGMLFLFRHDPRAALADFDAALAIDPGDTTILVNRGLARLQLGAAEEALTDFERARELDPRDAAAHYGAAQALALLGRREAALERLRRAFELDPNFVRDATAEPRFDSLRGDPEFLRLLREHARP